MSLHVGISHFSYNKPPPLTYQKLYSEMEEFPLIKRFNPQKVRTWWLHMSGRFTLKGWHLSTTETEVWVKHIEDFFNPRSFGFRSALRFGQHTWGVWLVTSIAVWLPAVTLLQFCALPSHLSNYLCSFTERWWSKGPCCCWHWFQVLMVSLHLQIMSINRDGAIK